MLKLKDGGHRLCCVGIMVGLVLGSAFVSAAEAAQAESAAGTPPPLAWPAITKECRPWTYWWWMGSAVDRTELTRHIEAYYAAGMGGVHIIPIYGAAGYEGRYIPYLTPTWMEMLAHTSKEAARLGMGVDMTTGTGWPFGGPWVGPEDAAAKVLFETYTVSGGGRLERPLRAKEQPDAPLQALMAFSPSGEVLDLTSKVDASGRLDWVAPRSGQDARAPSDEWKLYAVFQGWTKQQVKRAAPGAEGNVLDYFSTTSLKKYLARFDEAFAGVPSGTVRSFYNDSYEVFGANWTGQVFHEFQTRRGYDLRRHLPPLLGEGPPDQVARVRHDYRQTIADLLLERFTIPWVEWCHGQGCLTRNQAHGSPGNVLDLYAAADIPETEGFGPEGAEILVAKLASSAAHVSGRPRVASESCTWLGEHFRVTLADAKPKIDTFFLSGINHVFYHGMTFSPADAPYPGWLFYASTNFGLSNTFWPEVAELNEYIARCQSFLQAGRPDPDVLLYFPIHDLWSQEKGALNLLQYIRVHNSDSWLKGNLVPTHAAAKMMWDRGYAFDYVSDRLLAERVTASAKGLKAGDLTYRTLVLAGCRLVPLETLERIVLLAEGGATVIVVGSLPTDVPGLGRLAERQRQLKDMLASVSSRLTDKPGYREARLGQGRLLLGDDLERMLESAGAVREGLVDQQIGFVRRVGANEVVYFLTNLAGQRLDGWVPIRAKAKSVVIFDPFRRTCGLAKLRDEGTVGTRVRLQLDPGESCILRATSELVEHPRWTYLSSQGRTYPITGTWSVSFVDGGPVLPKGFQTDTLGSWTDAGPQELKAFSGTARYTIAFTKPAVAADEWILDLGRVCHSGRVRVNGQDVGAVWCPPNHLRIGRAIRDGRNTLELDVRNLMANRIADMDRRRVPWRKFFFVNIDYKPFDASGWTPLPSGLLGPVCLRACSFASD